MLPLGQPNVLPDADVSGFEGKEIAVLAWRADKANCIPDRLVKFKVERLDRAPIADAFAVHLIKANGFNLVVDPAL